MFAAVDFRVRSPGFLGIAAGALHHIGGIEPALQMSAAELALFVFFIAGALPFLLDFYFVMGKLSGSLRLRSCDFVSCQAVPLVRAALVPPDSALRGQLYSKAEGAAKARIFYKPLTFVKARGCSLPWARVEVEKRHRGREHRDHETQ